VSFSPPCFCVSCDIDLSSKNALEQRLQSKVKLLIRTPQAISGNAAWSRDIALPKSLHDYWTRWSWFEASNRRSTDIEQGLTKQKTGNTLQSIDGLNSMDVRTVDCR
jgi:hypothetical protein